MECLETHRSPKTALASACFCMLTVSPEGSWVKRLSPGPSASFPGDVISGDLTSSSGSWGLSGISIPSDFLVFRGLALGIWEWPFIWLWLSEAELGIGSELWFLMSEEGTADSARGADPAVAILMLLTVATGTLWYSAILKRASSEGTLLWVGCTLVFNLKSSPPCTWKICEALRPTQDVWLNLPCEILSSTNTSTNMTCTNVLQTSFDCVIQNLMCDEMDIFRRWIRLNARLDEAAKVDKLDCAVIFYRVLVDTHIVSPDCDMRSLNLMWCLWYCYNETRQTRSHSLPQTIWNQSAQACTSLNCCMWYDCTLILSFTKGPSNWLSLCVHPSFARHVAQWHIHPYPRPFGGEKTTSSSS